MVGLAELESEKARRERAKVAGKARAETAERKLDGTLGTSLEAAPSPKLDTPPEPKEWVRAAAAKSAGVSERKVKQTGATEGEIRAW